MHCADLTVDLVGTLAGDQGLGREIGPKLDFSLLLLRQLQQYYGICDHKDNKSSSVRKLLRPAAQI